MDIIELMTKEVKSRCYACENIYGPGIWTHHIVSVVEHAKKLAKRYGADIEIVTLSAILHDVASVTNIDYVKQHHIIGAEIAEELLSSLNYPQEKINRIKLCILNHRGSKIANKQSIEEICVADADSLSHFDNIPSLFSMVYKEKQMTIDEGAKFIKEKLDRSFLKLSDETKMLHQEKYKSVMSIFE